MARIAQTYKIPFMKRVTMPAQWARWLSQQGQKNPLLYHEPEVDGTITWDYEKHGLAPWMQFFYDWRFADLTGDGLIDFVLTGGARRQIAYRQDGSLLWTYEDDKPSIDGGPGFLDIRLDSNFPIVDIDGDNVPELVCARRLQDGLSLCIVNGINGEIKRSIPFPLTEYRPGDCRGSILVANLQDKPYPSDIVVSWDYACLVAYDSRLRMLWYRTNIHTKGRKHVTMGHTPYPADINGDGRDEIMAGSTLYSGDGGIMWVAPDLPALITDGHADSVKIVTLRDGDYPRVVMSTGAYCFNVEGKLLWGHDALKHGQALHTGKIRNDVEGNQIVIYEGTSRVIRDVSDRILALSSDGEQLWDFHIQQPDMQEGGFGFWLGDWNGDGLDEIFVNDHEKVNILDGYGNIIETIPGHLIYVFDLLGDSRSEAVVLTGIEPGMQMQIWTNDAPNTFAQTNRPISRRMTTKHMYNCTRY